MSTWETFNKFVVDYASATYAGIKAAAEPWTAAMRATPAGRMRVFGVEDFLAMSPQHDPFYKGAPSDMARGEWFMEVWYQQGMDRRAARGRTVYVRTMHYNATDQDEYGHAIERVAPPPPPWGGGREYENTVNDYEQMVLASACARYLGYLPFDAVVDKRNVQSVELADATPTRRRRPPRVAVSSDADERGTTSACVCLSPTR